MFETKNCEGSVFHRGVTEGRGAPFVGTWLPTFTESVRVKQSKKNASKKNSDRHGIIIQVLLTYLLCFLLGISPASELYMPTFRNTDSLRAGSGWNRFRPDPARKLSAKPV